MLFGYFDYVVLGILIFLNIKYWKKGLMLLQYIIAILSFGLFLPLISLMVEVKRVQYTIGIIDNFEVFYTYIRFPTYWVIGVLQLLLVSVKAIFRKPDLKNDISDIKSFGKET